MVVTVVVEVGMVVGFVVEVDLVVLVVVVEVDVVVVLLEVDDDFIPVKIIWCWISWPFLPPKEAPKMGIVNDD